MALGDKAAEKGFQRSGGEGGIRTLGTGVSPYNGLANRRIRPLCHLSGAGIQSTTVGSKAIIASIISIYALPNSIERSKRWTVSSTLFSMIGKQFELFR